MVRRMSGCRHGNHISRAGYWIRTAQKSHHRFGQTRNASASKVRAMLLAPGRMRPFGLIDQDLAT